MVIRKEHAVALLDVKKEEEKGLACQISLKSETEPYAELELQNLLEQGESPVEFRLTYWGRNLSYLLEEMVKEGLINHPVEWDDRFRWIGTEVIAMLEASEKNGDLTGDTIFDELKKRGFAQKIYEEKRGWVKKLNKYGKAVLNIFRNSKPRLVISKDLAQYILSTPVGPAETKMLAVHGRFPLIMEAMRLISFSIPNSDVYTLSGLGQAVRKVCENLAPTFETVINEDYMFALIKLIDNGIESLTDIEKETLSALGYINTEGDILPAGETLLEVYKLWSEKIYRPVKTFNLELLDEEILLGIERVWQKNKENKDILPTDEKIVHFLLEKPLKEYKHLKDFYGRMINQSLGYQKKEELKRKWAELFTIEELFKSFWEKGNEWYERLFDTVKESLYSLEAFNLIKAETDEKTGKVIYKITEFGHKVLEDIKEKGVREIKSTAVKALTITKTEFGSPNINWYRDAVDEHLVGGGYPTKSGSLYEYLAYNVERLPHISRFEMMVLKNISEKGTFLTELLNKFDETLKEEIQYALNKLEAKNLLEILPNDALVLTEAGKLIKKALSGTPEGIANPINPIIVRILKAIKETGNLYIKERKIRILPKNLKEVINLANIDAETFNKELTVMRLAGFVGKTSITEAGMDILDAVEILNN